MPNRREPATKEITEYIINEVKILSRINSDNIYLVMGGWLVLGEQAGFTRKEWAQDCTHLKNI